MEEVVKELNNITHLLVITNAILGFIAGVCLGIAGVCLGNLFFRR
jgi:hypothetical protein